MGTSGVDVKIAVCLHGIASVLLHGVGRAAEFYGQVVRVSDGDTIIIADGDRKRYRVRLAVVMPPPRVLSSAATSLLGPYKFDVDNDTYDYLYIGQGELTGIPPPCSPD